MTDPASIFPEATALISSILDNGSECGTLHIVDSQPGRDHQTSLTAELKRRLPNQHAVIDSSAISTHTQIENAKILLIHDSIEPSVLMDMILSHWFETVKLRDDVVIIVLMQNKNQTMKHLAPLYEIEPPIIEHDWTNVPNSSH